MFSSRIDQETCFENLISQGHEKLLLQLHSPQIFVTDSCRVTAGFSTDLREGCLSIHVTSQLNSRNLRRGICALFQQIEKAVERTLLVLFANDKMDGSPASGGCQIHVNFHPVDQKVQTLELTMHRSQVDGCVTLTTERKRQHNIERSMCVRVDLLLVSYRCEVEGSVTQAIDATVTQAIDAKNKALRTNLAVAESTTH